MKKYVMILLIFFSLFAQGEMVDTFAFKNEVEHQRAIALAKSLRCPQCQNQNLVESNSPIAYDLRLEVYQMVDQGKSDEQIIQQMTERFGNFVLYKPPFQWTTALLWLAPLLILAVALGLMWRYLRSQKTQKKHTALCPEQQQALAQLLQKNKEIN